MDGRWKVNSEKYKLSKNVLVVISNSSTFFEMNISNDTCIKVYWQMTVCTNVIINVIKLCEFLTVIWHPLKWIIINASIYFFKAFPPEVQ